MIIEKIYEGKSINLDTKKIENKLDNEINRVLNKNNKKIDNEEKEAIQTFKNAIINVYNTSIVYSNSYIEQITLIYQKMNKVIKMAQIILIIAINIITIITSSRNIANNIKSFSRKQTIQYFDIKFHLYRNSN